MRIEVAAAGEPNAHGEAVATRRLSGGLWRLEPETGKLFPRTDHSHLDLFFCNHELFNILSPRRRALPASLSELLTEECKLYYLLIILLE